MKKLFLIALMATISIFTFAQGTITVSGTITASEDGSPIPFANVHVRGTMIGTSSNDLGQYQLEKVPVNAILVFSSIGYTNREIPLNGRAVLDIALDPDAQALEEVIMVAYGTAKKGTYTGAASVVKKDAIKDLPTTSFEQALNGKVAGMQITTNSGQAGSTSAIRVRGIGSMNASNEPLYVIDGVPVISGSAGQMGGYIYTSNNIMSTLNPSDIESITVLKDAAAASLYGSRAANGVVVITTKQGKSGKPQISFKASVGITPSFATVNFDIASPEDQVKLYYENFWNADKYDGKTDLVASTTALRQLNRRFNKHGYTFSAPDNTINSLKIEGMTDGIENREGKYFNWEDVLFRTAIYQTYDLAISGASDFANYYTSFSYTDEQGRSTINDFNRIAGRVNLTQKVGKFVEFNTNVNVAKTNKKGFNDTRDTRGNYFMQSRNLLWPLYWPTDYKTGDPYKARYGSYAYNPVFYNNEWENSSNTLRLTAAETVTIKILPELFVKSVFSYDYTQVADEIYFSADHYNAGYDENNNRVSTITNMGTNYNKIVSSTTANYNKTFGKHTISLLAGFEAEKNISSFLRGSGENQPTSSLKVISTAGKLDAGGYYWGNSMLSLLSRAEYNYDNKYYASASFRRDGSSRLGIAKRWGNFWSVAGSWRITEEEFMKDQSIISNLRLRASYGINGTLPSNNYGWRSLVAFGAKYMAQPGGGIANIADPNLSWETSYTTNLALEFGLFDQRVFGTVEVFNRDSKNLLQDVPISLITGFSSTLKNIGEINNKGLEIELGGEIIRNNQLKWNVSLTGSFVNSKVVKLYGGQDIIWYDPTGDDYRAKFIYREGENMLSLYGLEWAGTDRETGKNVWYVNDPDDPTKGAFKLNGRGASFDYSDANEVILGSAQPKFFGGINTDVTWKGVTLGLNFIYKLGGYTYNAVARDVNDDGYYWERIMSQYCFDNRWTPENKDAKYPQRIAIDMEDVNQKSSRHMNSATFLRLKNVSLAYTFPKSLISKANISNLRVFFNGSNLLTLAAHKEYDPEVNEYGSRGWEIPLGKTYTFGLEFTF